METGDAERDIFAGLSKASGFVRSELGRRLSLRYLPDVIFKKDVSGPRGDRIMQLLEGLHGESEQPMNPGLSERQGRRARTHKVWISRISRSVTGTPSRAFSLFEQRSRLDVTRCRRQSAKLLGECKVGHAGTLDPSATGVLPILVGRATRIAEYLIDWDKEYRAVLRLGETTDTQDATGQVLSQVDPSQVTEDVLQQVIDAIPRRPTATAADVFRRENRWTAAV